MFNMSEIVRKELDIARQMGAKVEIEDGGKHFKVRINGKFCAILPKGKVRDRNRRNDLGVRASIRRALAQ